MADSKKEKTSNDKLDVFIQQWVKQGLIYGALMYVVMTFLFPWMDDEPIKLKSILVNIPIWILGGLSYGYLMKTYANWAKKKK